MTEQHQSDARRIQLRMSLQLLASLAAAVAAPFVADVLGWNLMASVAAVAAALVLHAAWRVAQAQRSVSADYVARLWMSHTVTWVYSVVAFGVASVVWLFVADEGPQGWENWIVRAYTERLRTLGIIWFAATEGAAVDFDHLMHSLAYVEAVSRNETPRELASTGSPFEALAGALAVMAVTVRMHAEATAQTWDAACEELLGIGV